MKLLMSDYDGTVNFHGKVLDQDVEAIRRFQNAGHKIGINTGRAYQAIHPVMEEIPDIRFDLVSAASGAVLKDEKDELIIDHPLDFDIVQKLIDSFPGTRAIVAAGGEYFYRTKDKKEVPKGWQTDHEVEEFDELKEIPIHTFIFLCKNEKEALQLAQQIHEQKIPVETNINRFAIDVTPRGLTKAHALKEAAQYFHIGKDQTYAIGDSWNDLPALKEAGQGFLMDSASDELQKEAKNHGIRIVSGVAEAIEQILEE